MMQLNPGDGGISIADDTNGLIVQTENNVIPGKTSNSDHNRHQTHEHS